MDAPTKRILAKIRRIIAKISKILAKIYAKGNGRVGPKGQYRHAKKLCPRRETYWDVLYSQCCESDMSMSSE
jgi:hypothetical protein